jgi:hypothetical protein
MKTQVELRAEHGQRLVKHVAELHTHAELVEMGPKQLRQLDREYTAQYATGWIPVAGMSMHKAKECGGKKTKAWLKWFEREHPTMKRAYMEDLMRIHKAYVGTPLVTLPVNVLLSLHRAGEPGTKAALAALRDGTPVTLQWVSEWRALPGNRRTTTVLQDVGKIKVLTQHALCNEDCTEEQRHELEFIAEVVEAMRNQ